MTTDRRDARPPEGGRALDRLRLLVDVRGPELKSLVLSFVYFFFVMSAWFVLRPIRDEIAAASGVKNLPWLFLGTLGATLLFNPLYGALVVRFRVRTFIAATYHLFVSNLFVFYLLMRFAGHGEGSPFELWMGRAFYVWTSVFNFFVISIFWSFMADAFTSEQAKRLFGFIGVGGTLGSITGSAFTAAMAQGIGTKNLLIVSAALLEIAVLVVWRFPRGGARSTPPEAGAPADDQNPRIGGSAWGGLTRLLQSPYLLAVAAFLTLYILGSTVLYAAQTDIVGRLYPTREARTTVLAQLELAAQLLTLFTQFFFTGRITKWFGLVVTLAVVPVLTMLGFGALGLFPVFQTLAVLIVCRRAANFSLMNPAMETLFTVVSREDKYKAKNFIETFVYRFSDQLTVWGYAGLAALGLGLSGIAFVVAPVAGLSVALAVWLGRRQREMERAGS
ncbi:MAG: MFS transporter [Candidatus Eisenbacteria bacterium]